MHMSDLIYLTLKGHKQGLISAGCSSIDSIGNKEQLDHIDQILVYSLSHSLTREQNVNYHPHSITYAGSQPQETISLRYKSITWTHHIAGTGAYSIWDDRIY
ncbi:type VI secretion system tube protein Hcp [Photorhabdus heterorhabditis]|nr:type VI secretion system tube protein Hcp [Photorhabdus heterorhabditis]